MSYDATILTDASHHHDSCVGGYGFWIASDRGSFGGGSHFKTLISDANIGEMKAIINAIFIGLRRNIILPEDLILIQTDSTTAIERLRTPHKNFKTKRNDFNEVATLYKKLIDEHKLAVMFKHVKAHTTKKDKRSIANKMCDKRARNAMRSAHTYFEQHGKLPQ